MCWLRRRRLNSPYRQSVSVRLRCGPLESLSVGKAQVRKIKYICSVRIFYVHYNDALYILHKPACYHCGGCGRAGDIRLAGAGDLLARRAVASPALAAVLRPAMGLCGEGCALLARLRPLVRVAGGPGGKREVSAPHISLSMRVASTSLPARTGAAGTTGALCSVVAGPLSGWEFWGVGGMMLTTGGDTGGAVTGGAEAGSAAEFPGGGAAIAGSVCGEDTAAPLDTVAPLPSWLSAWANGVEAGAVAGGGAVCGGVTCCGRSAFDGGSPSNAASVCGGTHCVCEISMCGARGCRCAVGISGSGDCGAFVASRGCGAVTGFGIGTIADTSSCCSISCCGMLENSRHGGGAVQSAALSPGRAGMPTRSGGGRGPADTGGGSIGLLHFDVATLLLRCFLRCLRSFHNFDFIVVL